MDLDFNDLKWSCSRTPKTITRLERGGEIRQSEELDREIQCIRTYRYTPPLMKRIFIGGFKSETNMRKDSIFVGCITTTNLVIYEIRNGEVQRKFEEKDVTGEVGNCRSIQFGEYQIHEHKEKKLVLVTLNYDAEIRVFDLLPSASNPNRLSLIHEFHGLGGTQDAKINRHILVSLSARKVRIYNLKQNSYVNVNTSNFYRFRPLNTLLMISNLPNVFFVVSGNYDIHEVQIDDRNMKFLKSEVYYKPKPSKLTLGSVSFTDEYLVYHSLEQIDFSSEKVVVGDSGGMVIRDGLKGDVGCVSRICIFDRRCDFGSLVLTQEDKKRYGEFQTEKLLKTIELPPMKTNAVSVVDSGESDDHIRSEDNTITTYRRKTLLRQSNVSGNMCEPFISSQIFVFDNQIAVMSKVFHVFCIHLHTSKILCTWDIEHEIQEMKCFTTTIRTLKSFAPKKQITIVVGYFPDNFTKGEFVLKKLKFSYYIKCRSCGGYGEKKLKICSRCRKVRYCSRNCQKNDWKRHKSLCRIVRKGE